MSVTRKLGLIIVLVLTALLLASCGELAETVGESLGTEVKKNDSASICTPLH